MTAAIEAGVPVSSSEIFARNLLTIVVPADNPSGISSASDLAGDDIRLVLANPDVPAGNYARQSLCKIAGDDSEFLGNVAANIVSEEENVRAVLTKVQLGEADAGIVYITDALTAGDDVQTVEIPAGQNVIASYPIAALTDEPLAAAFVSYVLSPEGQATLASFGFEPIN
jgi:molybdate transport system substrate-binding protein